VLYRVGWTKGFYIKFFYACHKGLVGNIPL